MRKPIIPILLAAAAFGSMAQAHHSYAMFDMQKTLVLNAQVTKF